MDDGFFAAMSSKSVLQKFQTLAHLQLPGEEVKHVYVIVKGWVKLYRLNEHGDESITCLCGPNTSLFNDLLFCKHAIPVGAQAETEVEAIAIQVSALSSVMLSNPQLVMNFMEVAADATQDLMYLVEQVTVQPAVERIAGFILKIMLDGQHKPGTEFELPCEKAEIARHLGITPETFSRGLKELAKRGVIINGRKIRLDNPRSICTSCDPLLAHHCDNSLIPGYCRMFKA